MTEPAPPTPRPSRAGRDLPAAILVGVSLLAVAAGALVWWNLGFVLLTAAALAAGALELHQALGRIGMRAAIAPILVGTVAIVVGVYLAARLGGRESAVVVLLATLGATVLAALVARVAGGPEGYVRDSAASLFVIGYVGLLGAFVPLTLAAPHGPARIVSFILCVVANDVGGYAIGAWLGRHKMVPVISPKKTWEGMAGSAAFCLVVGVVAAVWILRVPWWVGLVLGACMTVTATIGDLVESLVKRDVGVKDMSSFLPGHGGVMDRLDSMLVSAPVAWFVLHLLGPAG